MTTTDSTRRRPNPTRRQQRSAARSLLVMSLQPFAATAVIAAAALLLAIALAASCSSFLPCASGFEAVTISSTTRRIRPQHHYRLDGIASSPYHQQRASKNPDNDDHVGSEDERIGGSTPLLSTRRNALENIAAFGAAGTGVGFFGGGASNAAAAAAVAAGDDENESFASIAERANKISKQVDKQATVAAMSSSSSTSSGRKSDKTAYDFTLPVEGKDVPFKDLIRQEVSDEDGPRVRAVVVVNMKQDDPISRKTIPELISLATKYGGRGAVGCPIAIIACPTDQGYYEPDTSQLIRLKLASEYGYGINPATVVTDKVNLLGSGAHPFWRWLESTCRTPAGLGRIEGNYEKFLIDGRTGMPVRRYPRKYAPSNMEDDVEALLQGKPLPPARANFQEEWRNAVVESQRDTYRFEKGLNWFDQ